MEPPASKQTHACARLGVSTGSQLSREPLNAQPSWRGTGANALALRAPRHEHREEERMDRIGKGFVAAALCFAFACAGAGNRYADVEARLPAPAAGQGRMFIYTPGRGFALSFRPSVLVDGQPAGHSREGSFLVVDRPAGEYTVEVGRQGSFANFSGQLASTPARVTLRAGKRVYLEVQVVTAGPALQANVIPVHGPGGRNGIVDLAYEGGNVSPAPN